MILNLYCYRNKAISAYAVPFFDNKEPKDMAITIQRMIMMYPDKSLDLKVCDLFHLGTFDDANGKFELLEPQFLISCGDYFKVGDKDA